MCLSRLNPGGSDRRIELHYRDKPIKAICQQKPRGIKVTGLNYINKFNILTCEGVSSKPSNKNCRVDAKNIRFPAILYLTNSLAL
jgi:hypothetical protein